MKDFAFKRNFELNFRLWHWFMAFAVFGLLFTGLLRETYLNSSKNGKVIVVELAKHNIEIDEKSAKDIAKIVRDPMWQWHNYFGFALFAAFLFGVYVRRNPQSSSFIKVKNAVEALDGNAVDGERKILREFITVKVSHILFLSFLALMVATGFVMYFKNLLGFSKDVMNLIKEVHELGLWFVLFFVIAHIVGVVKKEITSESGLISSIVGGK